MFSAAETDRLQAAADVPVSMDSEERRANARMKEE